MPTEKNIVCAWAHMMPIEGFLFVSVNPAREILKKRDNMRTMMVTRQTRSVRLCACVCVDVLMMMMKMMIRFFPSELWTHLSELGDTSVGKGVTR